MNKKIVFAGPVGTRSGYGARARDICKSLIELGYDLKIIAVPWGSTPQDALDNRNTSDIEIINRIHNGPVTDQPDIFIHCTIPNEFQPIGKFNIGLTAGIETDACQPEWIEGCNRMDLILTSSDHSKKVFETIEFEKRDKNTNQVVTKIKCNVPVEVLFEGVDTSIYFKTTNFKHQDLKSYLDSITESFAYLFVGHWLQGDLGQDRKDVGMLINTFLNTFMNEPESNRPALILKTSLAGFSLIERHSIEDKIYQIKHMIRETGFTGTFPNIYLLFGDLNDSEMNELYNHSKIKSMVSFTKGEGFGRPLLEFTTTGKPILASNWSGQVDFLHSDYSYRLPGGVNKVHESAVNQWIVEGSSWFTVNYGFASSIMKTVFNGYQKAHTKCKDHIKYTLDNFTIQHMTNKLKEYLENTEKFLMLKNQINATPIENKLNLPKINLPKLTKIDE
jgi:glycosyltransferase involved in cell wall biosynthesis